MFTELETRPVRFVYEATLNDGTDIFVYPDGTATNMSGKVYKEITDTDCDGDLKHKGWVYAE